MLRQIQTAVALIYPPRCLGCGGLVESDFGLCGPCWRETPFIGGTICESCGMPLPGVDDGFRLDCDDCMTHPRVWSQGRAALLYRDQARALVLALKHGDRGDIAKPAAGWMLRAAPALLGDDPLIAPVPLHWTRLLKRRYNQSALLARELAKQSGIECCVDLLLRRRRTETLDGKTRAQRFVALGDAIALNPRHVAMMRGRVILLVDDVMTSGATLTACSDACLKGGAREVRVVVLARVTKQ
ncbi:MAG: amidophosphoribosyltransferase [Rhodobacteraceae bacterium]|nr:MAG: amidophosphoribosyltransferase [Paracoccaceae bacterium]